MGLVAGGCDGVSGFGVEPAPLVFRPLLFVFGLSFFLSPPPPPKILPTALVIPVHALPSNPLTKPAALPSKLPTLPRSIPLSGLLNSPLTRSPIFVIAPPVTASNKEPRIPGITSINVLGTSINVLKNSPGFVNHLSSITSLTTLNKDMNILNPPPKSFLLNSHHGSTKFFHMNFKAPGIAPINLTSCVTFSVFFGSAIQSKTLYKTKSLKIPIKKSNILPRPFLAADTTGFFFFLPFFAFFSSCLFSSSSLF